MKGAFAAVRQKSNQLGQIKDISFNGLAFTYLAKPIEMAELEHNVNQAFEKINLLEENQHLQQQLKEKFSIENFIFHAEVMQQLMETVLQAADSMATS